MAGDIVNHVSIGSQAGNFTGSTVQFINTVNKSVWIRGTTNGSLTVTINASENGTNMDWVKNASTYVSGAAVQTELLSYTADMPYMNAVAVIESGTGITSNLSVTFTGRGL